MHGRARPRSPQDVRKNGQKLMDAMKKFTSIRLGSAALVLASVLLGGCAKVDDTGNGNGGGGGAMGPVTVAITDLASDEIVACTIQISSVHLIALNGTNVSVLTSPVRVDIASLSSVSQVIASVNVPAGLYTQANITVDLGGAACFLVGHGSQASIVGTDGLPITGSYQLPLELDAPLNVTVNGNQLVELDFDLDQSFVVDLPGNTVQLEPAFLLRVNSTTPKPLLVHGTLTSVNTGTSTFVGSIASIGGTSISSPVFHSSPTTVFQIDGAASTGSAGLTALSLLGPGAGIECLGSVSASSTKIEVTSCLAGAGTFDGGSDSVEGHIVDRTGAPGADAMLTVLGFSDNAAHDTQVFATPFIVNVNFANTKVVRVGSSTMYGTNDLNVGQRVRIYGALSGTTLDATAATSVAVLEPTSIFGVANGPVAGSTLSVDVTFVDELPVNVFAWGDGGSTPPDPTLFLANVGALGNGQAIVPTSNVAVRGFFSAVNDPGPDLVASALSNVDTGDAEVFVRNDPTAGVGIAVAVTTTTTVITLTISGTLASGEVAIIDRGHAGSIPLPTSPAPKLARVAGTGAYSLRDRSTGAIQVYTHFSDFASAVGSTLLQGATLVQIAGRGTYNAGTNTIDADSATAVIQ